MLARVIFDFREVFDAAQGALNLVDDRSRIDLGKGRQRLRASGLANSIETIKRSAVTADVGHHFWRDVRRVEQRQLSGGLNS